MDSIFRRLTSLLFAVTLLWIAVPPAAGQTLLDTFSEGVDEFTLENGLTFITCSLLLHLCRRRRCK